MNHIMHIFSKFGAGGAEAGVSRMIQVFPSSEYKHSICSIRGNIRKEIVPEAAQIFSLGVEETDHFVFFKLYRLFKRHKVTIAHANNLNVWIDTIFASKLANIKCVETFHGIDTEKGQISLKKRLQYRILAILTDSITAVSQSSADMLSLETGIRSSNICVINNGIDSVAFCPAEDKNKAAFLKNEFNLNGHDFLIGCVAGLREVKNHKGLLDGFKLLLNLRGKKSGQEKQIYMFFVGDGPLLIPLKKYAKSIGVDKQLFFMGQRADIKRILQSFDLFVMNSITEGLSYSIFEAMACGLPVVATNVGGNRLQIEDGKNGFLVSPDCPSKMAEAMNKIIETPELGKQMGINSRKKVIEEFSMNKMAVDYLKLYDRLIH